MWALWAASLSPYALKLEAVLRHVGLAYRWLPASGSWFEAQRFAARRRRLIAGRLPLTWPRMTDLDEFPLVPFLFGPDGENLYDSSAIGAWLGQRSGAKRRALDLLPADDPALRFAVRLVDEALDEVGLYLVHHNRWVLAARDNGAGGRLRREMRPLMGPAALLVDRVFPPRQVRRLPYLFSVADPASGEWDDLPLRLRPPARPGFPPTHALLGEACRELIDALEPLLTSRPFLFGERFTLADASVYGQLGMNQTDPSARAWIAERGVGTDAWVARLARGEFRGQRDEGLLELDAAVTPLLAWVCRTFVPLMQQNHAAWERHTGAGETRFNEAAFDRGRALYDGELMGHPFRSVAKTFQVRVWRDLRAEWDALPDAARAPLEALLPAAHGLGSDGPLD